MSLPELLRRIRLVLDNDSPTRNLPEALNIIDAFVRQQQDTPEHSVLDQLRDDLECMYKELVDHTSSLKVEAFVSILCAFSPISRPLYVITHWWDLVLRAALRDPRLSVKTLQQVKELTLHALISDSTKATEFRKRIIELYLDAYDESSQQDALERATMSAPERRIQQFWKNNLGDILEEFCKKQPETFLTIINFFFMSPQWRLRLSVLLGAVVRLSDFPAKEFAAHPILDSLLLSLVVDASCTLFEIEIAALAIILPQIAVHAPDSLKRVLPLCYAVLARVVCWRQRPSPSEARDDRHSESSQAHGSDLDVDSTQTLRLRPSLDWQKLEATSMPSSNPPSPLPLFRCLYALLPRNTLAFLREPVAYINQTTLECLFVEDWSDILDEDQIRTRAQNLLRHTIIHPLLLMHTVESELAAHDHWAQLGVPRIATMCTMLDVHNAALSLRRIPEPEDFQHPEMSEPLVDPAVNNIQSYESETTDLRSTDLSFPGRPRISVQDILATYNALKSGVEIDIVDPTPIWPNLLLSTVPSPSDTTSTAKSSPGASDETLPPHIEGAISALQRENLLLRNELNHELWLKRENVKRIGRLHQDHIVIKGAEVERQGLHNKLREYKGQVQRLQEALAKEQAGATATKSQHTDYSNRLQAKLKAEKEEKRNWAQEKSELKRAYEDAKAMLDAQAVRLADASTRVFELETQIKENSPKVLRLRDYEHKIEQFTKTQQLWDDDVRRYKKQELYLDELRSRYRKKLILIESYENANQELADNISSLKARVSTLEAQASLRRPPDPTPAALQMMEALRAQVATLTSQRDELTNKKDELGDEIENLKITVDGLRAQVLQIDTKKDATIGV